MPKTKQRTTTVWDPAAGAWRLRTNVCPSSLRTPIEILEINDANDIPIDIKDNIESIKNDLLDKDIYKEIAFDKNTIAAIAFKGHSYPSTTYPGFWTALGIGTVTAIAGIGKDIPTYLRLTNIAPLLGYNATQIEYNEYKKALEDYNNDNKYLLDWAFYVGIATTGLILPLIV